MAHLNCLPPRAAGVNDWFFLLAHIVVDVSIKQNARCCYARRWNECAKLWIFREIAKWRRWRYAPLLTAPAVITDSRHRFSKRWHVADVKNIVGDDQTTLMVHRNSANIACTFPFYVCLRLCDRDCCSAADGSGSCHAPAPSYFKEMTHCWHQKLHWRWPGNPNGRWYSEFRFVYVYTIATSAPAAPPRLMTASGDRSNIPLPTSKTSPGWPGSIVITQIRKFMPTRSSKTSR